MQERSIAVLLVSLPHLEEQLLFRAMGATEHPPGPFAEILEYIGWNALRRRPERRLFRTGAVGCFTRHIGWRGRSPFSVLQLGNTGIYQATFIF